ncbi:MAG: UDP-3-O-(3-hydroxymyristoyl)glucosamine N-acyltransferase [Xanthomonadales bacterium]|nr:UDP-3-O-(3-hydroxymyristoyl)glucosamine N-acyltransferase [Xanthomonadales bacterium]
MPQACSAAELAADLGLQVQGDGETMIHGVATLSGASPEQLSFLANAGYRKQLASSRAGAIVLDKADAALAVNARCVLISTNPYADFARIAARFGRDERIESGIHPTAVVADSASVSPGAHLGAYVVVGPRCTVASGAVLGPGSILGEDCHVGADTRLVARVTLVKRVRLGERVLLHPGVVIGADGFGLAPTRDGWIKVPQMGGVLVSDDCEIGANTTIDCGAIEDTILEEDVRLDNQIQVAHNVRIGAHTAIAGCTAIAGSTRIGRHCLIAGAVGISGHLEIADRVRINAMTLVSHSIHEPGEYAGAAPMQDARSWRKNAARLRRLDALARRMLAVSKEDTDD